MSNWNKPTLLPFNSVCAACLSTDATFHYCTIFCEVPTQGLVVSVPHVGDPPWPHLHRTCKRCGFQWLEMCLGIRTEAVP